IPLVLLSAVDELDLVEAVVDALDVLEVLVHLLVRLPVTRDQPFVRASWKAANASAPNSTKRTSSTSVPTSRTGRIATRAASWSGYPYTPVEIAGKATERAPSSSATRRLDTWHRASSSAGFGTLP